VSTSTMGLQGVCARMQRREEGVSKEAGIGEKATGHYLSTKPSVNDELTYLPPEVTFLMAVINSSGALSLVR
jgi:hypothetical protein